MQCQSSKKKKKIKSFLVKGFYLNFAEKVKCILKQEKSLKLTLFSLKYTNADLKIFHLSSSSCENNMSIISH